MSRTTETIIRVCELAAFIQRQAGAGTAKITAVHLGENPHCIFVELIGSSGRPATADVLISSSGRPVKLLEYYEEQGKASWDWSAIGL